MFPLCELVTHAESSKPRPTPAQWTETRRSPRRQRFGNLTLYPQVERPEPIDPLEDDPMIIAALSNVSREGMGLIHTEQMPEGLVFEVDWEAGDALIPLRLEVVHSRQIAPRMYRTGARIISDVLLPEECVAAVDVNGAAVQPEPRDIKMRAESEPAIRIPVTIDNSTADPALPAPARIMRIDSPSPMAHPETLAPAPPGTLRITPGVAQFVTTQRLTGASPCGFERNLEVCRVGDRLWIYIHSPGKKNGWGIYVDPAEFEQAMARIEPVASPAPASRAA